MKLKYKHFLLFFLPLFLICCKKEAEKKPDVIIPVTKTEMLTAVTWKYNEYFINYNQTNTVLAYKPGKPNNLYDLSKSKLNYYVDNTYEETLETGNKVFGNWKFIENQTKIELNINQKIILIRVNFLSATSFQWSANDSETFARMIPQ